MKLQSRYVNQIAKDQFRANPALAGRLPHWLSVLPSQSTLPVTLAVGSDPWFANFVQQQYDEANPTWFVGRQLILGYDTATAQTQAVPTAKLTDFQSNKDFIPNPLSADVVFGTARLPFQMREPIIMQPNAAVRAIFTNNDQAIACYLYPWIVGYQYRTISVADQSRLNERKRYVCPYWLTLGQDSVVVPSSSTLELRVKVTMGHFEGFDIVHSSTGAYTIDIQDAETRQSLSNSPMRSDVCLGNAQYPYELAESYLIPQGSILNVKLTNLTRSDNTIYFSIHGRMFTDCKLRDVKAIERDTMIDWDSFGA